MIAWWVCTACRLRQSRWNAKPVCANCGAEIKPEPTPNEAPRHGQQTIEAPDVY